MDKTLAVVIEFEEPDGSREVVCSLVSPNLGTILESSKHIYDLCWLGENLFYSPNKLVFNPVLRMDVFVQSILLRSKDIEFELADPSYDVTSAGCVYTLRFGESREIKIDAVDNNYHVDVRDKDVQFFEDIEKSLPGLGSIVYRDLAQRAG